MSIIYTVLDAYVVPLRRWRFPMGKWVAVPKPSAELEPDKPDEETDSEGNVITHFKTRFGVRYARVVEPTGFVLWLQEVP